MASYTMSFNRLSKNNSKINQKFDSNFIKTHELNDSHNDSNNEKLYNYDICDQIENSSEIFDKQ